MRLKGIIHCVEVHTKLIGIRQNKRIVFFYFQNSQMNLLKDIYIQVTGLI